MLKDAGIQAILDHHAPPGVQTPGQSFTGHCTTDVEFYVRIAEHAVVPRVLMYSQTEYNYHRALVWTAVMTALSHLDPSFGSVFAIEAVNEPIMDATQTPGYGDCKSSSRVDAIYVVLILRSPEELRSGNPRRGAHSWHSGSRNVPRCPATHLELHLRNHCSCRREQHLQLGGQVRSHGGGADSRRTWLRTCHLLPIQLQLGGIALTQHTAASSCKVSRF